MSNPNKESHWRRVMNTAFLNGDEINKEGVIVTIKAYKSEDIFSQKTKAKEPHVTLFFDELKKPMILTNRKAKQISNVIESPLMDNWIGKKVCLFPVKEKHFGEFFEVINIKEAVVVKDVLNKKHPRWDGAIEALTNKETTLDKIKKHFEVSKATETLINKLINDAKENKKTEEN